MRYPFSLTFACLALLGAADSERMHPRLSLLDFDITRGASLIVKALYREHVAGTSMAGLTETEVPFNDDNWFWTDDNAKALEALSLPPVLPKHLTEVEQLVKFIRANSPPPFVFRRRADDRTLLHSNTPENFRFSSGLMDFHGDLMRSDVRQGYRFHDNRQEDAAKFSSDHIKFSIKGKSYTVSASRPNSAAIEQHQDSTQFSSTIDLKADTTTVGSAVLKYTVTRAKPYIGLTLTVTPRPGFVLTDVEATTSLDQMDSLSSVRYAKFACHNGSRLEQPVTADGTHDPHVLHEGRAKWWTLVQNGNLGFSYAVSTLIESPTQLKRIVSTDDHGGVFRHVRSEYALGTISEQPVSITEKKVLFAGGLYNSLSAYDAIFDHLDEFPGLDLSISYDIGAELNGVAAAFLADHQRLLANPKASPVAYTPETRAWFDAILDAYQTNFLIARGKRYPYLFPRGHAFVVLALDLMHRATGDQHYLEMLNRFAEILLRFQIATGRAAGGFTCLNGEAFFDCHAASMIALSRAALVTGQPKYAEAAYRGLYAYKPNPRARVGEDVYMFLNPAKDDRNDYFWVFKAGLMLRSLEALTLLDEHNIIHLGRDDVAHIQQLRTSAVGYLARTAHARGNLVEFLTSHRSGETNSETQSWVVLGLYRTEHSIANNLR
jgi:hypothetical protein